MFFGLQFHGSDCNFLQNSLGFFKAVNMSSTHTTTCSQHLPPSRDHTSGSAQAGENPRECKVSANFVWNRAPLLRKPWSALTTINKCPLSSPNSSPAWKHAFPFVQASRQASPTSLPATCSPLSSARKQTIRRLRRLATLDHTES